MKVSIIIPCKNGLKWLKNSIPLFFHQNGIQEVELIILDSGSTDGLKNHIDSLPNLRIKYISVDPNEFNHGLTRNLGVINASNEIIVFTVQDATPIGLDWLISLVKPLKSDNLDAVCGSQVVLKDQNKNPIEWHRPIDKPSINKVSITPKEFSKLSPLEKKRLTGWDNVNAAYKKSSLKNLPFKDVIFGEDAYWAVEALNSGFTLAYTGFSQVNHYHHYTKMQFKSRYLAEFFLFKKLYNLEPERKKIKFKDFLSSIKTIFKSHKKPKDLLFWLEYNLSSISSYNESIDFFRSMDSLKLENYILNNQTISTNNSK